MMRKKKRENQTVRTALTTLLLSHHLVPRVTVATKMHPRCDRILTVRKGIFLEVETRRCATTPSSPVARHDETATSFSSARSCFGQAGGGGTTRANGDLRDTSPARQRRREMLSVRLPKTAAIRPPVGARAAPRRRARTRHSWRRERSGRSLSVRVHWPPTRKRWWAGWSPGDSAPRPRAVAGLRPEPAGWRSASASASHPRAGDGERVHAAAVARTRLRYLVRLPGQESRGSDFRGRRAPRRCPTTRGKIYEAWCSRVPVGRSQRHAPGRSSFPSLSEKPPMGNATPWPVRRHVAIASANCMPWRILMCPTRIRCLTGLSNNFLSFFFPLSLPLDACLHLPLAGSSIRSWMWMKRRQHMGTPVYIIMVAHPKPHEQ